MEATPASRDIYRPIFHDGLVVLFSARHSLQNTTGNARRRGSFHRILGRPPLDRASVWDIFAVMLFPISYMAMTMTAHVNVGIRHILPIYPFLFIFLGITFAAALRQAVRYRGDGIDLGLGLAVETYWAYPDFIPFLMSRPAAAGKTARIFWKISEFIGDKTCPPSPAGKTSIPNIKFISIISDRPIRAIIRSIMSKSPTARNPPMNLLMTPACRVYVHDRQCISSAPVPSPK